MLLVRSAGRRFVVRLNRGSAVHDVRPAVAARAARLAGEAGLGPAVRYQVGDVLVLDHVDGRHLTAAELDDLDTVRVAAALLARVRSVPVTGGWPDRRTAATLTRYVRHLAAAGAPVSPDLAALVDLVRHDAPAPVCFVHGDCHPGNLLLDGDRLWLIDWDHAGIGEVLLDRASLVVNAAGSAGAASAMHRWLAGEEGALDRTGPGSLRRTSARLGLGAALRDLLWGLAEEAAGESTAIPDYVAINRARVAKWAALAGAIG